MSQCLSDPASAGPAVHDTARLEAARYALLRRLAPALRHDLVVHLQPLRLVLELMDRRLAGPAPELTAVRESAQRVNTLVRAALEASTDTIGWLAPESRAVPLDEGVAECVRLLASGLGFRGVAVEDAVGPVRATVSRASLRSVLCASLLHIADARPEPLRLRITADATDRQVTLGIAIAASDAPAPDGPPLPYRALTEGDVQALAQAEGGSWRAQWPQRVSLVLPCVG